MVPSVSPIEQGSSYQWSTTADDSRPPYVSPPAPSHANLADPLPNYTNKIASPSQGFPQQVSKFEYDSQGQPHPVSRPSSAFQGASTPQIAPTASALGYGGPSDWEHFAPASEDSHESVPSGPSPEKSQNSSFNAVELPSHPSPPLPPQAHDFVTSNQNDDRNRFGASTDAPPSLKLRQTTPTPSQSSPKPLKSSPGPVKPVKRVDSIASDTTNTTNNERPGSIDGVIQAWSEAPPGVISTMQTVRPPQTGPEDFPDSQQRTPTFGSPAGKAVTEPKSQKETHFVDPYGDLEPEYKASLARFVTMLRKETVATTDEEKFRIFKSFLDRETKLRQILYSIDTSIAGSVQAHGIVPGGTSELKDINTKQTSNVVNTAAKGTSTSQTQSRPMSPKITATSTSAPPAQPKPAVDTSITANSTAFNAGGIDSAEYSPGGRPMVSRAFQGNNVTPSRGQRSLSLKMTPQSTRGASDKSTVSPGANAPIVLDQPEPPRSFSVPPVPAKDPISNKLPTIDTNRPVYTPFRYTEGPQRGSEPLTFDRPPYQAYSNLRQASLDSGRAMAQATSRTASKRRETPASPSTAKRQHEETFLGLIRENGSADQGYETQVRVPPQPTDLTQHQPQHDITVNPSQANPMESLRSLLPSKPFSGKVESAQISAGRRGIETFPEDFSFIHDTVVAWDASYKPERARLERERYQRQEESEHRIDALFNDNEIGYSDIGDLEETFRREETDKKLLEDRRELESFKSNVFAAVDGRLKKEIDEINQQYEDALKVLETATAGQRMLETQSESPHISQAMQIALTLFKKLEIRHQKRVEAVLERERRRRKIELALWYSLGDVAATKNLADQFEMEERRTLLKAAQEKDERANRLMDHFDRAIIRALGDNQRLTESIAARITDLKKDVAEGRIMPSETLRGTLNSTEIVLEVLSVNSEACLQSFDIADKLLNEADYDVSVANVRLENGDAQTLQKLQDEKKVEDAKLQDDLHERLGLARKSAGETKALIKDIFEMMGNPPDEERSPDTAGTDDAQRQERLKKALEEAKRRNAAKE
jgi:hypothetical protein